MNPHSKSDLLLRYLYRQSTEQDISKRPQDKTLKHQMKTQATLNKKLDDAEDQLIGEMFHELWNPFTNIKIATKMLGLALNQNQDFLAEVSKPDIEKSKAALYFTILENECERGLNLLNNLFELQHLEATMGPNLPTEVILVQTWLTQILQPMYTLAQEHQQTLSIHLPATLPALTTEPARLRRILVELVNNAYKYTPAGEKIVVVAGVRMDVISFSVSNSGVEIPAPELSRVFDKFYRIANLNPWKESGTGLGLTLVKKLAEHLGGSVKAESADNITCFTLSLPLLLPKLPPHEKNDPS
jgi:signal transduction histidine kinase